MSRLKFVVLFVGLFSVLLVFEAAQPASKTDFCASLMPEDLTSLVLARFPHARLPQSSEWTKDDVDYNIKSGGTGCLGIIRGDFDGDKQNDFAFLLASTKKKGDILLMVARHQRGNQWMIEQLRNWTDSPIRRLYIEASRPRHYERAKSLEGTLSEPGELEKFDSKFAGVVSGNIESSGVAYFFDGKNENWVHVWISD